MKLLFCGSGWLPVVDCVRQRLDDGDTIEIWDRQLALTSAVADADVILPSNAAITEQVINAATKLTLIQQPAAGVDAIDVEAATRRNVPVCNAPGANHLAVAEATLLLMLALARRLPRAQASFAAREIGVPLGVELHSRHLGIVGLGRIGSAVAERAAALGMTVHSVRSANSRSELHDMLGACDVVTIHAPLTEATRGLFDDEAFAAMKPGATIINCSRGPLIERDALVRALDSGHLGGAGLDVFWQEPWNPDDPLFRRDDVITLPHIAGSTEESFARIANIVAENLRRLKTGEPLLHQL